MSGEKKGNRERIDAMVQQMVNGGAKPDYARQKAIDAAKKSDRRN